MGKMKCIITESGLIIPIHNIVQISSPNSSPRVWTIIDKGTVGGLGREISRKTYNALMNEIEWIGGGFVD